MHAWACTYYGELRVCPDIGYQEKSFTDKYGEGRELRLPLNMHGQKPCVQARRSESTEERGVYTLYPALMCRMATLHRVRLHLFHLLYLVEGKWCARTHG